MTDNEILDKDYVLEEEVGFRTAQVFEDAVELGMRYDMSNEGYHILGLSLWIENRKIV